MNTTLNCQLDEKQKENRIFLSPINVSQWTTGWGGACSSTVHLERGYETNLLKMEWTDPPLILWGPRENNSPKMMLRGGCPGGGGRDVGSKGIE